MWIRSAFWEGRTKPGLENQFRRLIDEEILIGLRRLPGVRNAKALWPAAFEGRPACGDARVAMLARDWRGAKT